MMSLKMLLARDHLLLLVLSVTMLGCPTDPPPAPGPSSDIGIDASTDIGVDGGGSDADEDTTPSDAVPSDVDPQDAQACEEDTDCPALDSVKCAVASCVNGTCEYLQAEEGTPCSDTDPCTTDGVCDAEGQCISDTIECDDNNPCTEDICNAEEGTCEFVVTPKETCDDGDGCTEQDQCSDDGECVGVPKECDDNDTCTTDACEEGECSFVPTGLCSTLLEESFECDGPSGEWEFIVLEGVITWAVDGEPDPPGAYGEGCSLNFNDNGNDYDSPGGAASFGQAVSPVVDATALTAGSPLYLSFYNYWDTEDEPGSNWDRRGLEVSTDGFETSEEFDVGHNEDNDNTWFPTVIDLSAYAGQAFQFRFYFDTVDSVANDGVGWFIDDVVVSPTPPELPPEVCDDQIDNDFDLEVDCDDKDCAFDGACVPVGDTCNTPFEFDTSELPASVSADTSEFGAHYGYPEGACPGETGGWGGGVGTGAPDVVYAFTVPSTDDYVITATGQAFDTNIYIVTNCDDIGSNCLAGSDNALEGEAEQLFVNLEEGTTYYLIVDGWSLSDPDNAGLFEVVLDLAPEFNCNDGEDNDGNGLVDCADPACSESPTCIPEANCNDGEDNDEDGQTDCDDDDCLATCVEAGNCDDGIDNDQNGLADCDDDACAALPICLKEICNDDVDNDGDGQTDCNDDECYGNPPCTNKGNNCNNAIEINPTSLPFSASGDTSGYNQNYGYADGSCPGESGGWGGGQGSGSPDMVYSFTPAESGHYTITVDPEYDANLYVATTCNNVDGTCLGASEVPGATEESVSLTLSAETTYFIFVDGWQNNAENVAGKFIIHVSAATESNCADGDDNDNNGDADCDDALCSLSHECTNESCFNGVDDDKDGAIDCNDSECSNACNESLNCDDGQDNDTDGDTDCDDADCAGTVACLPEICDDGVDNDEDGKLDCDDPECLGAVACKAAGDICEKPVIINELPYTKTLSTCDFEDTIKSQAGGGCFIGGEDLPENIYSYTAAESMTVIFDVTPGAGDPNLMLNIATQCQATVNQCIGGDNPLGEDPSATVDVEAGKTYYIIIDGFSGFFPPACGSYTLTVTPVLKEAGKCTDGIDNDNDGDTDCDDSECADEPVCGCSSDADCPNQDACTLGVCDVNSGTCGNVAVDCDDSDVCTEDTCEPNQGGCQNAPVVCDDGVDCTTDFCSQGLGCGSALNHALCDDDSVCTTELCDKVNDCVYESVDCNDGVECTVDSCDATDGCIQTPANETCDDDENCTTDTCDLEVGCINEVIDGCDGATCDSAIQIEALPFSSEGTTSGYGDTVSFAADSCVVDTEVSLALDGIDSHVTFEQGPAFDYSETDGLTLGFWIRVPLGFGNPGMIIVQGPASWYLGVNGFQALSWRPVAPTTATSGNGALIEGVWHHVTATYDNVSFEARLFVDGVEKSFVQGSGPLNFAAGLQPHLGRNWSEVNLQPLFANIDEFAIFNRALGEGEVMDLYMGSAMAPESMAPDHWWRMGEGDNFPTVADYGSLNSPGTVQKGLASDFEAVTPDQPAGGEGAGNVIYTVTAQSSGVHRALLTSDYGATLYVVGNCESPSETCEGMDMSMGAGETEVTWTASEGNSYTIVVDGTNGGEGTYNLSVEAL